MRIVVRIFPHEEGGWDLDIVPEGEVAPELKAGPPFSTSGEARRIFREMAKAFGSATIRILKERPLDAHEHGGF